MQIKFIIVNKVSSRQEANICEVNFPGQCIVVSLSYEVFDTRNVKKTLNSKNRGAKEGPISLKLNSLLFCFFGPFITDNETQRYPRFSRC